MQPSSIPISDPFPNAGPACQALIAWNNTAPALSNPAPGGNVYFGTGLTTPTAASVGVPLDALQMLLLAAVAQSRQPDAMIFQEISDTHAASTNPALNTQDCATMAARQREIYETLALCLNLPRYRCVLASEYQDDASYLSCLDEVRARSAPDENAYVTMQSAGNLYFIREKDARTKIGWLVADDLEVKGRDERWFNRAFNGLGLERLDFVYGGPGRTFDENRPRVSPYTMVAGESRLRLDTDGDAVRELAMMIANCPNAKIARYAIENMTKLIAATREIVPQLGLLSPDSPQAIGEAVNILRETMRRNGARP